MTLADAMQSGIQPAGVNYGVVSLHQSRFIPELGARRCQSPVRLTTVGLYSGWW
jgi:hypothetical protein